MMRPSFRLLTAVLIIITVFLIDRNLNYIRDLQDRIHSSRLINSEKAEEGKPRGAPSNDGAVATVSIDLKADISRILFVSVTTTSITTTDDTTARTSTPEPISRDQIIVLGRTSEESTSWVEQLDTWQNAVYSVDNATSALHTLVNKGREANVYLTYILENYHNLPSTIAFCHPHEKGYPRAWHTDAQDHSNIHSLRALNVDFVQRNGYSNLRCIQTPGCPDEIQPFREPDGEDRTTDYAFPEAWKYIFGKEGVPRVVATPCCAQFAVSKDQVLKRPLEFYSRAHQWLLNTPLSDKTSGRVFEYLWHIIFGQTPIYCPDLQTCYKDVYSQY